MTGIGIIHCRALINGSFKLKKNKSVIAELIELSIKHGNDVTRRRIGFILDKNGIDSKILKLKLSKSKSFIPLVPGQSSKGKINSKWGIIENDNS